MIDAALVEAEASRQRFLRSIGVKEEPIPKQEKVPEKTQKMSARDLALLLFMTFTGR